MKAMRVFLVVAVVLALAVCTQTAEATYRGNPIPFSRLRITLIAVRVGGRFVVGREHRGQRSRRRLGPRGR